MNFFTNSILRFQPSLIVRLFKLCCHTHQQNNSTYFICVCVRMFVAVCAIEKSKCGGGRLFCRWTHMNPLFIDKKKSVTFWHKYKSNGRITHTITFTDRMTTKQERERKSEGKWKLGFRIKVKILLALEGHSNKTRFINKLPRKQVERTNKKKRQKQFTTHTHKRISRFCEKCLQWESFNTMRVIRKSG